MRYNLAVFSGVAIIVTLLLLLPTSSESSVLTAAKNASPLETYEMYSLTRYAEASHHESTIKKILRKMPKMKTADEVTKYVRSKAKRSPITGQMVFGSAEKYGVSPYVMLALMQLDSDFGTKGKGARSHNPGNIGTYDNRIRHYASWEKGVDAVAWWLSRHRKE